MSKQNFRAIGSDPEVFVKDPSGKIVPIIGLVGGSKEEPLALGDGYAVQEDGVALEYNIPVCLSTDAFMKAIEEGLRRSSEKLPAGYGTVIKPDHEFEAGQLEDPLAWISGCDPDFSAWTMKEREGLNYYKAKKPLARYCGGHIHISYADAENKHPMTKIYLVRIADMLMGLPARWLEGDSTRSKEFGAFGIYRPKSYGLEYRTMSNIWMNIPELQRWVADSAFYVAGLADRAEQYCSHIYRKDTGNVAMELIKLLPFTQQNVKTWQGIVYGMGIAPRDSLLKLLFDACKYNKPAQPPVSFGGIEEAKLRFQGVDWEGHDVRVVDFEEDDN